MLFGPPSPTTLTHASLDNRAGLPLTNGPPSITLSAVNSSKQGRLLHPATAPTLTKQHAKVHPPISSTQSGVPNTPALFKTFVSSQNPLFLLVLRALSILIVYLDWENGDTDCWIDGPRNVSCLQGFVPIYVAQVEDVDDVQASVEFTKQHQLSTTVKNSGHDLCVFILSSRRACAKLPLGWVVHLEREPSTLPPPSSKESNSKTTIAFSELLVMPRRKMSLTLAQGNFGIV